MMSLRLPVNQTGWESRRKIDLAKYVETTVEYEESVDGTDFLNNFLGANLFLHDPILIRTSPIYDLSSIESANSSIVVWDGVTPSETEIKVESSLSLDNGSTWQPWVSIFNRMNLQNIYGTLEDLKNVKIQFKQTLSTTAMESTPELKSFGIKFHDASQLRVKENWQMDTRLLAKFLGDLEAGNINNSGIEIIEFAVKRRRIDEIGFVTLKKIPFENNKRIEYIDNTQPNDQLIYSIVPIGENGLEGKTNDIQIESDFVGWWIVDKYDINNTIRLDTFINGTGQEMVNTSLNQGRVSMETMNKYPQVYYTEQEYHSMTLNATIIPSEWERSNKDYQKVLKAVTAHAPMIVKGSNGSIFVCDLYAPKGASLVNATKTYDYFNITLEAMEVQDYKEFMEEI